MNILTISKNSLSRFDIIFKSAILFFIVWFLATLALTNPADFNFLQCRFKEVTGLNCPTCGLTRSFESLITFNIVESFLYHPMGIVIFVGLFFLGAKFIYELSTQNRVAFTKRIKFPKRFLSVVGGIWLIFWIVRIIIDL